MKQLMTIFTEQLSGAFEEAGYDPKYGTVRTSDRPDLCEYQCNGAMAAAKQYHKAPFMIADEVAAVCAKHDFAFRAEAVRPGFLNLIVKEDFLASYIEEMADSDRAEIPQAEKPLKIIVDYGGPNVAKPLHVGHLRAAVIGESIKRIERAVGHEVLGDIHLGDWGLQIGLVITEVKHRWPDLPYFTEQPDDFTYPEEAPFTVSQLEEIYPAASAKSKEDEAYREEALAATHDLQEGRRGYRELWKKILEVSVADLKKNYERLDVHFDLWKSESDAQPYIPGVIEDLKAKGLARMDQGALVVDVTEDMDKKELPPCIILKSDGASLYSTTDIATIVERVKLFDPDEIIYVVDKRQGMHFEQVFRVVRKAGIVKPETKLYFAGFGTMNGRDGKPFKTRDGGVMRLESLLNEIEEEMTAKIRDNKNVRAEDAADTAAKVALAAVKYGDLSNQASKDYIFDTEKFTSFEGNTGPYILYTLVRIKSILEKADVKDREALAGTPIRSPESAEEKALMLSLTDFGQAVTDAAEEYAPHRLCAYVYRVSNECNRFYHATRILGEEDTGRRRSLLKLLSCAGRILDTCIDLLGFTAPEHM
ncbi:MAG: arginine--tRNA ligase [Lachnospiraceae bacterium]|nr:arginine--tRNA ligase [Lachnospiraceae bacterium]